MSNFTLQMIDSKLIENKIAHVNQLFNFFVYNLPTSQVNRLTCSMNTFWIKHCYVLKSSNFDFYFVSWNIYTTIYSDPFKMLSKREKVISPAQSSKCPKGLFCDFEQNKMEIVF